MAGIIFDDYCVSEASFKKNPNFNPDTQVTLETNFKCCINIKKEDRLDEVIERADVILFCEIGDARNESSPFEVKVTLSGDFVFNPEESDGTKFEKYLSPNAIAILFPYLRSVIANLTTLSNEFPTLNIPVVNIAEMMLDNELIEINYID